MAEAYILINCDIGSEEEVITALKAVDGIKEVHGTFGAYDLLVKIESDTADKLRDIVSGNVRKIGQIRSTLTLMGIEDQK